LDTQVTTFSSAFRSAAKHRRVLIVVAFIFAAVVSPTTDIFTQVMIAVPMIVLYEASILLVRFILRK
jgi:sec-independent protein translocase protein TatC